MEPGLVVDAIRELTEHDEVLRTEIELPVGTSKIETALRRQLPFRIFSAMSLPLSTWYGHEQSFWRQSSGSSPEEGFAWLQLVHRCSGDPAGTMILRQRL